MAAVVVAGFAAAAPAIADDGDPELGEIVYKKCKACHEIGEDAKNKVGPRLTGVVGRPAGSIEDFRYSTGMQAAGEQGLVWAEDTLFEYVQDPRKFLRAFTGNRRAVAKMPFKLKSEDDRRNVIAYLKTFE